MLFLLCQALTSHMDKSAWLEAQVRQLLQTVNQQQNRLDLRSLVEAVDTVKQKITLLEASDQRLGACPLLSPGFPCMPLGEEPTPPACHSPALQDSLAGACS